MATQEILKYKVIRLQRVKELTGWSTSSVYYNMNLGLFPSNFKTGGNSVGWYEYEVMEWLIAKGQDRNYCLKGQNDKAS